MSLANEYRAQTKWRNWPQVMDRLPPLSGQVILDLGCGVGDFAAMLADCGAHVIGLDINQQLLEVAVSKQLSNAEFRIHDLREPLECFDADGIWCSYVSAFFPDLRAVLLSWAKSLAPGGWIALTEIDNLLGHEPVSDRTRKLLDDFAEEALLAGRYDFHMGHKLGNHLESAGFSISQVFTVEDRELSFQGPADPGVVQAWRARFERMRLLQAFCGADFPRVQAEFLDCLASDHHVSEAKVYCCIGIHR